MNQEQLKKRLNTVPVPDDLAASLEANWQQQFAQMHQQQKSCYGRLLTLAASVLLAVVMLLMYQQPPAQVELAYKDILKDADLKRPFLVQHQQWFKQHDLAAIPDNMQLEMIKDCHLGAQTYVHFRVAGEHQGKVNVFIRRAADADEKYSDAGEVQGFRWHRFSLENNVQVLVLFDEDMRKQGVNRLLKTVFADYSAMHV